MKLSKQLSEDLNYLNMTEIKSFCRERKIPFKILFEKDGVLRNSGEMDRKGIILERIRLYLSTGHINEATIFIRKVVAKTEAPKKPQKSDKVFFGHYKNQNLTILTLMKKLTNGKFKFGAIAQETIRDYWTHGKVPTYAQFAKAWLNALEAHKSPNKEWAYLSDRFSKAEISDWKNYRKSKAESILKKLKAFKA